MAIRDLAWVPSAAWLAPGYAEWAPPAELRDVVACLWAAVAPEGPHGLDGLDGPEEADRVSLVLPDACSDLIWQQGVGGYVAGPDTGPVRTVTKAGTVIVGVRLRPSAGGQALGLPLSEVRDQRVPLEELLPSAAKRLPATMDPAAAATQALAIVGRRFADGTPDRAVAHAADLLRDPAARAEAVAEDVGLSERQFRRRCQAAVGYGPKTLQRVLRFQRFVRMLDAAAEAEPPDLAAAAARVGYADQAHLTRECVALSGLTPAVLARVRGST